VKPVVINPAALQEMIGAETRLRKKNPKRADDFESTLDGSIELLAQQPQIGTPIIRGLRSFTMRRFPFNLIYADEFERVYILALAHHKRRSGYWLKRLK
jgi:plasmid stabilization system protein ParE